MVEGVVEVEAVTCCAGDTACPIAVASALERAPILDSYGRRQLGQRRRDVHCHFDETDALRAVQAPYRKKQHMLQKLINFTTLFRVHVYCIQNPATRGTGYAWLRSLG